MTKRPTIRDSRAGMTLIEVLIASLLFIMGLTTFLAAFTSIQRTSTATDRRMKAMHQARSIMEALMSMPFESPYLYEGTHSLSYASYKISPSTEHPDTKNIVVSVPWISPYANVSPKVIIRGSTAECMH